MPVDDRFIHLLAEISRSGRAAGWLVAWTAWRGPARPRAGILVSSGGLVVEIQDRASVLFAGLVIQHWRVPA